jgi:hypothetical protein
MAGARAMAGEGAGNQADGNADPALVKRAREISDDPKLHERLSCARDLEALRTEIATLIEKLKPAGIR